MQIISTEVFELNSSCNIVTWCSIVMTSQELWTDDIEKDEDSAILDYEFCYLFYIIFLGYQGQICCAPVGKWHGCHSKLEPSNVSWTGEIDKMAIILRINSDKEIYCKGMASWVCASHIYQHSQRVVDPPYNWMLDASFAQPRSPISWHFTPPIITSL